MKGKKCTLDDAVFELSAGMKDYDGWIVALLNYMDKDGNM